MTSQEFFDTKIGQTVRLNTELWFGQGQDKGVEVLKVGTTGTVVDGLTGFFDYFLYVDMQGKTRRLKIQSLEKA